MKANSSNATPPYRLLQPLRTPLQYWTTQLVVYFLKEPAYPCCGGKFGRRAKITLDASAVYSASIKYSECPCRLIRTWAKTNNTSVLSLGYSAAFD